ncbi:MAG: 23S rRNA (guanosine(2251)-2'-O)-methyltransferase RlmB [Clostridia bacterium]|nr:23S rRNA (guanosine(2251)-2'-O)-methyltransferase RlmB [Clostridia bacterium]
MADNYKKRYKKEKNNVSEDFSVPSDRLEGRNPVMEALNSGRTIDKIYVQAGERSGSVLKIVSICRDKKIPVIETEKAKLDKMSSTGAHQGVIAAVAAKEYVEVEDILAIAEEKGEKPFIVICDEINDPHNLGSILRTSNAAGVHGVIIPKRNSVGLTATVAKSSAGAVEFTPVAKVTNLARTIDMLKERNIWVAGADMSGENDIYSQDFSGGIAIVIGSEGFGISRLILEKCDFLVKIPMLGEITSLNASVAGALMIYEVVRTRNKHI